MLPNMLLKRNNEEMDFGLAANAAARRLVSTQSDVEFLSHHMTL